jgi:hypothetical protein
MYDDAEVGVEPHVSRPGANVIKLFSAVIYEFS